MARHKETHATTGEYLPSLESSLLKEAIRVLLNKATLKCANTHFKRYNQYDTSFNCVQLDTLENTESSASSSTPVREP